MGDVLGYPHGPRPGDVYPAEPPCEGNGTFKEACPELEEWPPEEEIRPFMHMVDSAQGSVELKICEREKVLLCLELSYHEMAQFYEAITKALLERLRRHSP